MKTSRLIAAGVLLHLFIAGLSHSEAATRNWKAATTGDWFTAGNWVEEACPTTGDEVIITNAGASVLLTNASDVLVSLTLSKTLTFSNWNSALSATTITIQSNGVMTCAGPFTNNAPSNNVYLVCTNLVVEAGGKIDVDGKGYAGGAGNRGAGQGPGAGVCVGASYACGGSHGGMSGGSYDLAFYRAIPYGSATGPTTPGSGGGGSYFGPGTAGGGVVRIEAGGAVVVNGTITANSPAVTNSVYCGGTGAGGSIFIQCATFQGTNGTVRANSGTPANHNGSGAGGRIAVCYDVNQQPPGAPEVNLEAASGTALYEAYRGDLGTLSFSDARFLTHPITRLAGQVVGLASLAYDHLTVSNMSIRFADNGFHLTVTNALLITGSSGRLGIGGSEVVDLATVVPMCGTSAPVVNVGGDLILTNSGSLVLFSATTNSGGPAYGALMDVKGDIRVGSGSIIYPYSHPTNGGSVRFQAKNLQLTGSFIADNRGRIGGKSHTGATKDGWGPGRGLGYTYGTSAGYGGRGGGSYSAPSGGGTNYGSATAPTDPGSGGGGGYASAGYTSGRGGAGGGLVWLEMEETAAINGTISANGQTGKEGGSGSGGAIYLRCCTLEGGSSGSLQAKGGNPYNSLVGGGGGGRHRRLVPAGQFRRSDRDECGAGRVGKLSERSHRYGGVGVGDGAGARVCGVLKS